MKKYLPVFISVCFLTLLACQSNEPATEPVLTKEQLVQKNLDNLKKEATTGDLVVRLGDDFLSSYIKYMNETDQSYSHSGIVVEKDGQKLVAHITPDSATDDRIIYVPIDSFLDKNKTLQCALYRYQIPASELKKAVAIIEDYRNKDIRFDRYYDLRTDDQLYCSEMISKAFTEATEGRLQFKVIPVPPKMLPLLNKYFARMAKPETIAKRTIMTIDNLYNMPECKPLMEFTLKQLPGQ